MKPGVAVSAPGAAVELAQRARDAFLHGLVRATRMWPVDGPSV
jgi:hypothetical protein